MRTAAATLALALLTAGCAQSAPGGDAGGSPAPTSSAAPSQPDDRGLVLEVAYTGGFVAPQTLVGRLPLVAVYADGRVITEGPVPAIYPGPALPNLQVRQLPPGEVQNLVDRALAAGVGEEFDYGEPPVADAASTRFTVVTADGTAVTEVYALAESRFPGPGAEDQDVEPPPSLTAEQVAARERLLEALGALTTAGTGDTTAYEPDAVAAIVTEWTDPDDGLPPQDPVSWLGPPLPGEELAGPPGLYCVSARAEAADAVLDSARAATATTPWTADDGTRWALTLRPLLPDESGCADLGG